MQLQDLVAIVYVVLFHLTVLGGITGPRHVPTHLLIVLTGLFTPFVAFDWARLGDVPLEAWVFCGAFVLIQAIHTLVHMIWPPSIHARGPEILFQPLIVVWVVALRYTLDPTLWYRGELGVFLFCLETMFLSLGVLMLVYISQGTGMPGDDVDIVNDPLTSNGNSSFFTAVATTLMITLFVVFQDPLWLLGACAAFVAVKGLLGPKPEVSTETTRSLAGR
jgi:hypothetical protein